MTIRHDPDGSISEPDYRRQRDAGLYLCRCPGPRTRLTACRLECRRCHRRIHRRHDHELDIHHPEELTP